MAFSTCVAVQSGSELVSRRHKLRIAYVVQNLSFDLLTESLAIAITVKNVVRSLQATGHHVDYYNLRGRCVSCIVADRKFSPLMLLKAGCQKIALRRPENMTLRRTQPPVYSGRRRPATRGKLIRPLPRHHKGREIPASQPDGTCSWQEVHADGTRVTLTAQWWHNVIPTEQVDWQPSDQALMAQQTWTAVVIQHPDCNEPMLTLMNVALTPRQAAQVVRDHWGIKQPPLVAKQLLGLHRQFVWAPDMSFRWPELSLVAATLLAYVGATVRDPISTGWWDRRLRATAGRLRRQLMKVDWRALPLDGRLCKKRSVMLRLPKGFHPALARAMASSQLS